jgi:predicted molibdopterin-dependent oxidoreductase YjgC
MATDTEDRMVTATINGREVKVSAGKTVLEAAQEAGIYIPALCYHPKLEPYGGCRLCIVEIEGMRGFPTSCTTLIADGMKIQTDTPKLKELRKGIFEMTIAEHPMTCLTCAKNQRCELQQLAANIGIEEMSLTPAYRQLPILTDSPFFDRDYNLCVLCGRCIRVCQEVRGAGAIAFINRGSRTLPGTAFDKSLLDSGCQSCGACVDICPTGALMERNNKWATEGEYSVNTTCPYCGVGCQLTVTAKDNRIIRVTPTDMIPNNGQACVKGRFGIPEFVNSPERLTKPLIRKNGELVESEWDEALELIASKLKTYSSEEFGFIQSSRTTNEDCYMAQRFTRRVMKTNSVDNCARV